jgi:hypothetical protein
MAPKRRTQRKSRPARNIHKDNIIDSSRFNAMKSVDCVQRTSQSLRNGIKNFQCQIVTVNGRSYSIRAGQHVAIVPCTVTWLENGSHEQLRDEDYWYGEVRGMAKDDKEGVSINLVPFIPPYSIRSGYCLSRGRLVLGCKGARN